jgi:hypothetical protein
MSSRKNVATSAGGGYLRIQSISWRLQTEWSVPWDSKGRESRREAGDCLVHEAGRLRRKSRYAMRELEVCAGTNKSRKGDR